MSKDVLGDALAELAGPLKDFFEKVMGAEGKTWFAAFKKFLRKENPWSTNSMWRTIDETTMMVNLSDPPLLLAGMKKIVWEMAPAKGWVKVQLRNNNLFVEGRKVIFLILNKETVNASDHTKPAKDLENTDVLHPNILHALFENIHLIPKSWKLDQKGCVHNIFFWGVGFEDSDGYVYIYNLYWEHGLWRKSCDHLARIHGEDSPVAILENSSR